MVWGSNQKPRPDERSDGVAGCVVGYGCGSQDTHHFHVVTGHQPLGQRLFRMGVGRLGGGGAAREMCRRWNGRYWYRVSPPPSCAAYMYGVILPERVKSPIARKPPQKNEGGKRQRPRQH